jgi:hypothetical protein
MKYECCACLGRFSAKDAIDGYAQGYRAGFLCPLCGTNLQDNFVDTHWIVREGKGFVVALGILGAVGTLAVRMLDRIPWPYYAAYALVFGAVVLYGYRKYPGLFWNPVISTRLGPGKDG